MKETLGESFGGCHVATVTAVGEGVAAAQTQPVTEVVAQLGVRRQTGLLPADEGCGTGKLLQWQNRKMKAITIQDEKADKKKVENNQVEWAKEKNDTIDGD